MTVYGTVFESIGRDASRLADRQWTPFRNVSLLGIQVGGLHGRVLTQLVGIQLQTQSVDLSLRSHAINSVDWSLSLGWFFSRSARSF